MKRDVFKGFNGRMYYPWKEMQVGDFFEIPSAGIGSSTIRTQAAKQKRRYGAVYTVMTKDDTVRVTRHK